MLSNLVQSTEQAVSFFKTGKIWAYFIPTSAIVLFFYLLSGGFNDIGNEESNFVFTTWDWLMYQLMYFALFVLLSPMYGIISRVTFTHFSGTKPTFSMQKFAIEMFRMVVLFVLFLLLKLLVFLPLTIIFWSEDSIYTTTLFFFIKAIFWGFAFIDYSLEIDEISIGESIEFFFKHLIPCVFLGSIFQLICFLSYLGLIIAPIFTAVLATVLYLNIKKNKA